MLSDSFFLQQVFHVPVETKQRLAEELHEKHGAELLRRQDLCADLSLLADHARRTQNLMARTRMRSMCASCGTGVAGGCCSISMAAETDALQMLMNMLIGIQVMRVGNPGSECCYLGREGCLFAFKPIFCLNYICSNIRAAVSPENLMELEHRTNLLLDKQCEVEKKLLGLLGGLTGLQQK
jgi:hypothetical protein